MHGGDRRELMNECPGCDVGEASAKALVDTQYQMLLAADAYQPAVAANISSSSQMLPAAAAAAAANMHAGSCMPDEPRVFLSPRDR